MQASTGKSVARRKRNNKRGRRLIVLHAPHSTDRGAAARLHVGKQTARKMRVNWTKCVEFCALAALNHSAIPASRYKPGAQNSGILAFSSGTPRFVPKCNSSLCHNLPTAVSNTPVTKLGAVPPIPSCRFEIRAHPRLRKPLWTQPATERTGTAHPQKIREKPMLRKKAVQNPVHFRPTRHEWLSS